MTLMQITNEAERTAEKVPRSSPNLSKTCEQFDLHFTPLTINLSAAFLAYLKKSSVPEKPR